jgi:Ketopantoate reductase
MRICIYGAGAIGGYLGVHLARVGEGVTLIARGPHLAAMRQDGLRLVIGGKTLTAHPRCTEDPAEAGPQDFVILTLKAHAIPAIVDRLKPLLARDTAVVTAVNGIPWWYFYKLPGPWENLRLESVDPAGGSGSRSAPGARSGAWSIPPVRLARRV